MSVVFVMLSSLSGRDEESSNKLLREGNYVVDVENVGRLPLKGEFIVDLDGDTWEVVGIVTDFSTKVGKDYKGAEIRYNITLLCRIK